MPSDEGHFGGGAERTEMLRLHASTRGLDDQQLQELAECAKVVRLSEGEFAQRSNEPVGNLLLVILGQLRISTALPNGKRNTIQCLGPDDQFGLLALAEQELLPVDVVAQQDCLLLSMPTDAVLELLNRIPLWGRNLLGSLMPRVRESLLDHRRRKPSRIIGLLHVTEKHRGVTSALLQRMAELDEQVGLLSDDETLLDSAPGPSSPLVDERGRTKPPEEVLRIGRQWMELDRVIIDFSINRAEGQLSHFAAACDETIWISDPSDACRVVDELTPLVQASPGLKAKNLLLWVLNDDQQVAPFLPKLSALCEQDFKLHWSGWSDSIVCSRRAGIERVIHHLRGVSIGLALGGGAARGMAHLGVLKVLEDSGIAVDRLSGTSAGALTGIVYAAGYPPDYQVEHFANDLTPGAPYRALPRGDSWYLLGKYRSGGWDAMLRKYLQAWRLEQLPLPFSAVSVDLVRAEQVIRREGDAVHALLESINLPLLSKPICRDGMALVDGGILNVVPADVLVSQGSNLVVAVDLSANILAEFAGNRPDTPTAKMKIPTTAQTLSRLRLVQDRNIRSIGANAADFIIEPDVSAVDLADFEHAADTAALGEKAAKASLEQLRCILHRLDPGLFPT